MTTGGKRLSFDDGDYSSLDDKTLIVLLHIYLLHALRCVTKIIHASEPDVESVFAKAAQIARDPTEENTRPLFRLSGNLAAIEYLIECKGKRVIIEKEIEKRLMAHGLSHEIIKFQLGLLDDSWIAPMMSELSKRGVNIEVYPDAEDREDVELLVIDKVNEMHRKIGKGYNIAPSERNKLPALPAELNMPVKDPPPWDKLYPKWFYQTVRNKLQQLLPAMEGVLEKTAPEKAKVTIDSHARQIRRERATRIKNPAKAAKNLAAKDVLPNPWSAFSNLSNPEASTEKMEEEEFLRRGVAEVEKKYGSKARQYIELLETHSKQEAAKKTGIGEATGRRYTQEFKRAYKRLIEDS